MDAGRGRGAGAGSSRNEQRVDDLPPDGMVGRDESEDLASS